jgi:hypothetical protein
MNRRGFFIEAVRVAETWLPTTIPQLTEWQRIGNQIDAAMIFARAHFIKVLEAQTVCRAVAQMTASRCPTKQARCRTLRGPSQAQRDSQT